MKYSCSAMWQMQSWRNVQSFRAHHGEGTGHAAEGRLLESGLRGCVGVHQESLWGQEHYRPREWACEGVRWGWYPVLHSLCPPLMCMCAESLQSCPTLWNAMDRSPPGSSVHGILQARTMEWVAVPSCRGCSWLGDRTWVSYGSCTGRQALYH